MWLQKRGCFLRTFTSGPGFGGISGLAALPAGWKGLEKEGGPSKAFSIPSALSFYRFSIHTKTHTDREQSPVDKVRIWHHPREEKPNISYFFFAVVCPAEWSRSLSVSHCLAWQRESRGAAGASQQIDVSSLWIKEIKERSAWILPKLPMPFSLLPGALLQDFTQVQHPQSLFSLTCFLSPSLWSMHLIYLLFTSTYLDSLGYFRTSANSRHIPSQAWSDMLKLEHFCRGQFEVSSCTQTKQSQTHLWSSSEQNQNMWACGGSVEKRNAVKKQPLAGVWVLKKCDPNLWSFE